MPSLNLDTVDLYYERAGSGQPLVLIAGMMSDHASWAPILPSLVERYDVIAFDNRCCGQSIPEPPATSLDLMVGDCVSLLDALEIESAHVVGHSMGGMTGLHLAARHPARVRSLVAASCAPNVHEAKLALFDDLAALYAARAVPRSQFYEILFQWLFLPEFLANEDAVEEAIRASESYEFLQSSACFNAQVAALRDFRTPAPLTEITVPVLAVAGDQDLMLPPAPPGDLLAGIPDLEAIEIAHAAHSLHWAQPAAFIEAVTGFHDRLASRNADQTGIVSPDEAVAE